MSETRTKETTGGFAAAIRDRTHESHMAAENSPFIERLGGLPDRKYHCSVLGPLPLREAIKDYENSHGH